MGITAVNKIFEESGQTPFADPGTTLATVTAPTLPTEATTTTAQAATQNSDGATQDNGATTVATEAGTSGTEEASTPKLSTVKPVDRKFFGKRSRGFIL